jgi:hypothetical protein
MDVNMTYLQFTSLPPDDMSLVRLAVGAAAIIGAMTKGQAWLTQV